MTAEKIKNPAGGNHRAGENESQTAPSYPAKHHAVKLRGCVLTCGRCSQYLPNVDPHSSRRCRYLGEIVRLGDECHVDPMSPEFDVWIAAEEERRGLEVTP